MVSYHASHIISGQCPARVGLFHLSLSWQSHLYLLVTDQGFLQEEQVVWESLHNVDGDSCFCDSDFHLTHSLGKASEAGGGSGSPGKQLQVDQVRWTLGEPQVNCVCLTSQGPHDSLLSVPMGSVGFCPEGTSWEIRMGKSWFGILGWTAMDPRPQPTSNPCFLQDYLIALSLQQQQQPQGTLGLSDLELAQQLQQEEYQQQGIQAPQARAPLPQVSPCVI